MRLKMRLSLHPTQPHIDRTCTPSTRTETHAARGRPLPRVIEWALTSRKSAHARLSVAADGNLREWGGWRWWLGWGRGDEEGMKSWDVWIARRAGERGRRRVHRATARAGLDAGGERSAASCASAPGGGERRGECSVCSGEFCCSKVEGAGRPSTARPAPTFPDPAQLRSARLPPPRPAAAGSATLATAPATNPRLGRARPGAKDSVPAGFR